MIDTILKDIRLISDNPYSDITVWIWIIILVLKSLIKHTFLLINKIIDKMDYIKYGNTEIKKQDNKEKKDNDVL